jgi:acyl carrier protein
MRDKIFKVFSQIMEIPIEQVNEDSSFENIETWDSLRHMTLVFALEEEFGIQFTDEQIMEIVDMQLIIDVVSQLLGKK